MSSSEDELKQKLFDQRCKIEELNNCIKATEEEVNKYRESLFTYEEENKSLRAELLDERLAKEEAIKQNEIFEESFKNTERASKDKKNMQQIALKKLEFDNDQKEQAINDLKTKMKEVEIQSMKNENALRDELELLKDKNN